MYAILLEHSVIDSTKINGGIDIGIEFCESDYIWCTCCVGDQSFCGVEKCKSEVGLSYKPSNVSVKTSALNR